MWGRKLLIDILFRLIDTSENYQGINDKVIDDWLARQHQNGGFREYFRKRDLQLLKIAGMGLGRTAYLLWVGQRMEHLRLLQHTKLKFEKAVKQKELINKK